MPAILFLLGAALFGAGLARRACGALLSHAEQIMWGLVAGWMISTLAAYFVARAAGRMSVSQGAALLAALWACAALLWLPTIKRLRRRGAFDARSLWRGEYAGLLLVLPLFAPVFWQLYATRMLPEGADGNLYSGGSTWYDLGFHLALTNSFLHGQNFPPVYTPFPPEPLLYPFLPDFQTALVSSLGLSLRGSLLATAVPLALALTGLFYVFALRVVGAIRTRGRAPAAALATILFLLNGGLGFLYFLQDWRLSEQGFVTFWSNFETNYANMGERRIYWTNFVVDTMLPQRPSLFGVPAALMAFTAFAAVWREWSEQGANDPWRGWQPLAAVGVLVGLLPLFHTHSYLAVGLVSGFLFLLQPRRAWLAFWAPAVALALPHLLSLYGHVAAGGFMRLQLNWRGQGETSWLLFWLRNVGVPFLLLAPAWLAAPRAWRKFYLAFVGLMAVSLCVVFSPNDYDNIKLMYYWYGASCVLIAAWLVRLAAEARQPFVASLLALASVATGLLTLRAESRSRQPLFSREEIEAAAFAREHTPPRAIFLTGPTIHQPVLSLAGRPVLRGAPAWLSTHGYEFQRREADVRRMYAGGGDAPELLRFYRVSYVYVGPEERKSQGANQAFYEENFTAAYRSADIAIFDTRALLGDNHAAGELPPPVGLAPGEFAARLDTDAYQVLAEFPRAGYAVYRYHKLAHGRPPRFREFMDDMKVLGRGVHLSADGWQKTLEGNKAVLTEALVSRDDFKAAHGGRSNEEYVDALYANAGVVPPPRERDSIVAALGTGAESRASALRRIAENREFYRRDYDAAYVLTHYFGYLRRNPDDPPDNNLDGYNFWLDALRRTGDYRNVGVAFLTSGEYESILKKSGTTLADGQ